MQTYNFILKDLKYQEWLLRSVECIALEDSAKDEIISADLKFSMAPRMEIDREPQYYRDIYSHDPQYYGICTGDKRVLMEPTGTVNLSRLYYMKISISSPVPILQVWITFVDPENKEIVKRVQLEQCFDETV